MCIRDSTFPDGTDTDSFAPQAAEAGIQFNPGSGWSADPEWGKSRMRLCFGAPSIESINSGVAALAEVCRSSL